MRFQICKSVYGRGRINKVMANRRSFRVRVRVRVSEVRKTLKHAFFACSVQTVALTTLKPYMQAGNDCPHRLVPLLPVPRQTATEARRLKIRRILFRKY